MHRALLSRHLKLELWIAALLASFAMPRATPAQSPSATLDVTVLDARGDDPLPYAVVGIAQIGVERFTDSRGRLILQSLAPGTYNVTVRRLGFTPVSRSVNVSPDAPTALRVRMERLPQVLSRLRVMAAAVCTNPGAPDAARTPEVHTLFALLRENADRYRLLVSLYPFVSVNTRAFGELRAASLAVKQVDVQSIPSRTLANYRPGRVVVRRSNEYSMGLPTILDLADDGFTSSHCYTYGGATNHTTPTGDETWLRLDVRANDQLNAPDVHGSFYLDSATAQLRKMDLELSRPDKLPRQLSSIASVQVSTRFIEIADGLAVISSICAVTRFKPSNRRADSASRAAVPVELQQLTNYRFLVPPVDVPAEGQFDVPKWDPRTTLARDAVWCLDP